MQGYVCLEIFPKHERTWIDPRLGKSALATVAGHTQRLQHCQQRNNRLYLIFGALGVFLLRCIFSGGIWHA